MGGPVSSNEIIIIAWKWVAHEQEFRLYFGLSIERVRTLLQEDPNIELRAFLGYSGWGIGQLEGEIRENSWIASSIKDIYFNAIPIEKLWQKMLFNAKPEFGFFWHPENPP